MAKITQQPRSPMWPWGGPRAVRERLVDPTQFNKKRKTGNPKAPALASAALMEFLAPARSAEELRMPQPALPRGHDADPAGFLDRPFLAQVAERGSDEQRQALELGMAKVNAPPERLDRMKALLSREGQMLELVAEVDQGVKDIIHLMWEAQKDEGL